jgi:hypothetical protein
MPGSVPFAEERHQLNGENGPRSPTDGRVGDDDASHPRPRQPYPMTFPVLFALTGYVRTWTDISRPGMLVWSAY